MGTRTVGHHRECVAGAIRWLTLGMDRIIHDTKLHFRYPFHSIHANPIHTTTYWADQCRLPPPFSVDSVSRPLPRNHAVCCTQSHDGAITRGTISIGARAIFRWGSNKLNSTVIFGTPTRPTDLVGCLLRDQLGVLGRQHVPWHSFATRNKLCAIYIGLGVFAMAVKHGCHHIYTIHHMGTVWHILYRSYPLVRSGLPEFRSVRLDGWE